MTVLEQGDFLTVLGVGAIAVGDRNLVKVDSVSPARAQPAEDLAARRYQKQLRSIQLLLARCLWLGRGECTGQPNF